MARKYPAPRFLVEPFIGTAKNAAKVAWGEVGMANRAQRAFNQRPTSAQKAAEKKLQKEVAKQARRFGAR